jgi:hypothetical protein
MFSSLNYSMFTAVLVNMKITCSSKALAARKGPQLPTGSPVPIQAPKGDSRDSECF